MEPTAEWFKDPNKQTAAFGRQSSLSIVAEYNSSDWGSGKSTSKIKNLRLSRLGSFHWWMHGLHKSETWGNTRSRWQRHSQPRLSSNRLYKTTEAQEAILPIQAALSNNCILIEVVYIFHSAKSQCIARDSKILKYFKDYTKKHCIYECLIDLVIRECKCIEFGSLKEISLTDWFEKSQKVIHE